ncbi:hypothetical protein AVEN_115316-1 [Araneus ventricosus]|uniref:Uncharacterized protein n=1 Tax=Araneus ventricosus TaxID=182803 RepID=A0A4Y1ZYM6_ARAVE|nr:hypothetical protein AVEN_115316-1 [Araneus ventricosus]
MIYYLDKTCVIAGISTTKVWQDETITSCNDARREDFSTGLKGGATPSCDEKFASDPPAIPRNLCRTCLHPRADLACRKNPEKPASDPLTIPRRKLRQPGRHPSEPASVIYASIPWSLEIKSEETGGSGGQLPDSSECYNGKQ